MESEKKDNFSVYTTIVHSTDKEYVPWYLGVTMYIKKDGVTLALNEKEVRELVKALPRPIGGRY